MKESKIIREKNFDEARKEIRKNENKTIIFSSNKDELNRKILEKESINILLLSQSYKNDRLNQRNSGLNHVMAKIAKKRDIKIGIDMDEIILSKSLQKSKILARVSQNIKLCNKNKIKMEFIAVEKKHKKDIYDLKALGLVLGMPTWMTKSLNS